MEGLSRNNHYVSQMYLNTWARNHKVEVYDLIVPNEHYPTWNKKNVKNICSYNSMFVRLENEKEIDDIEKWFADQYETPVKESLTKAITGKTLTKEDWEKLINFMTCHLLRSPAFLQKLLDVAKNTKINIGKEITKEQLEENIKANETKSLFPIKITDLGKTDQKNHLLQVETIIGKQYYLWSIKNHLEKYSKIFQKNSWGIIEVDKDVILPTSDNPVISLNYRSENDYSLDGVWNQKNTNILFPISSNRIIYCQVGNKVPPILKCNKEKSEFLKKIICENAYRKIISIEKDQEIPKLNPRIVDKERFLQEKDMWNHFQKEYLEKEKEYIKRKS